MPADFLIRSTIQDLRHEFLRRTFITRRPRRNGPSCTSIAVIDAKPRGGQLDRQRNPVRSATDFHDSVRLAGPWLARSPNDAPGTLNEKVHGGGFVSRFNVKRTTQRSNLSRRRTPSPSRLVAKTRTVADLVRMASVRSAAAFRTVRNCRTPTAATGLPARRPRTHLPSCRVAG